MPRFVILEHDHPVLHWDLMLEQGEVLRTWRLLAPPQPAQAIPAEATFDHRPLYLDYEGPVSGGRGRVRRWDGGTFQEGTLRPAAEGGRVQVMLEGTRLQGEAVLEPTGGKWVFFLVPRQRVSET
jgi:hypothetical protein